MSQLSQYTLTDTLHDDGDTLVYRAVAADGRTVVIKTGRDDPPSPRLLATLRHEYTLLRGLDVPGVVRAEALERVGGNLALVLEDCGGRPLHELTRAGRLDLGVVLHIGAALAATLAALHRLPLLHKDIKPGNVVYEPGTGAVKLIDFSIATRLSQEPQRPGVPGAIEGTLAYMSPEQTGRMNRALDHRSDLYSLGATLYELLTGAPPFVSDDPMETIRSHLARRPVPPRERAEVPPIVSDIVMQLLVKQPEERYQTADGLRADLERCLADWRAHGTVSGFALAHGERGGVLRLSQRLHGRAAELTALLASFERIGERRGGAGLLLVGGYAGAGKSSLVHEIQRPIARRGGLFLAGKFEQYDRAVPYAPIVEALRGLCRQLLAAPEAALARSRTALLAALGPNGRLVADLVPELGHILGPQPAPADVGPGEAHNRFNLVFAALLRVFAILCYATPVFFFGLILKLVFAVQLGWLPVAGRASTGTEIRMQRVLESRTGIYLVDAIRTGDGAIISDVLLHAVLPAVALGLLTAGVFLRLVRTNMIGTLGTGYIEAARSRGVSERRLLRKHAYRPALIPIITVIGMQIAMLMGGAVLTETTFEWKGLGFQLVQYLQARDFVAVQGMVAMLAVIVAVTNFVVDVIAAIIDPRVRY